MERSAGILLSVTSLPSPYGIGTIGKEAREFADFLKKAGQKVWQILPVGPTSYGDSPYQSFSTFAGNPYFIDLDLLIKDKLLTRKEVTSCAWGSEPRYVDYGKIYESRFALLEKAKARGCDREAVAAFESENSRWLPDYALFMALKRHFGMKSWTEWPDEGARLHKTDALERYRAELRGDVELFTYIQFLFFRQWSALKSYINGLGIRIIGDLPMYVAPDSADVWAQPAQFRLDPDGQPSAVAGVPPDYFSADGQLWGNPLYDWDAMRADGFRWWKDRIRGAAKRYDVVRLDHFRAISSYWVVPRGELTARGGHWAPGPGPALLQALHTAAPELELIAEDLGTIDDDVRRLVARSGCPGMRVLLFGFDPSGTSEHRPDRVRAHSVCYVGTHDNAPAAAWAALGGADADYAMRCLGVYDVARLPEALLRAGMGSRAELFIAQMQDVLGLGAESRMNTPGTASGNWVWRLLPGQADAQTAARLLARTQAACRA